MGSVAASCSTTGTFCHSDRPRSPTSVDGPLWAYRLHWAYQTHQNIFPLLMAGLWEKTQQVPNFTPTQMGLTLSRLIKPGERVDLFGRFGLFRHFEDEFQGDFWSYNAYITAMFKAYSAWSDRVAFRWGLSFGVSYAEKIPAVEFYKFDAKGKQSSHLLNYLEWQMDFPLDSLIKSEITRGCFIGATVTHRSGIFGTSDLLGNVAGGSDWAGIHVECQR